MFAYYLECEKGNIPQETLDVKIAIGMNCGNFSYAEIAKTFNYILGVTGTLKTLSKQEVQIIQSEFKIELKTYMPSVFGDN